MLAPPVALFGVLVAVPVGTAIGRLVWQAFAGNLGVTTGAVMAAQDILGGALGTFLVANVAGGPAGPGRLTTVPGNAAEGRIRPEAPRLIFGASHRTLLTCHSHQSGLR